MFGTKTAAGMAVLYEACEHAPAAADTPKLIATGLAAAMLVAPIVRHVSAELNQSLGTQFPFSLAHCRTPAMPGCDVAGKLRFAAGSPTR